MGQKVSPVGFRVGVNKAWNSQWFADKKDIAKNIKEDNVIRTYIKKKYYACAISSIVLERTDKKLIVNIYTARPGIMIGTKGAGIEVLKKEISKLTDIPTIIVNIREIKRPDLDATLVAESIATQLEKRVAWRKAMKQALQRAMKAGAKGCKVMIGGRLDGADIARSEHYQEGSLPLHTIRSDVDYGTAEAHTTFGIIGVKVWVYKGEIYGKKTLVETQKTEEGGNN